MFVTIIVAGGGHGAREPLLLTFPITFITGFDDGNPFIWMMFQLPFYGLILTCQNGFLEDMYLALP